MVTSKNPKFWKEWLKEAINLEKLYGYEESFYYAWLPNTMEVEEIAALEQAAKPLGLTVIIDKTGAGEVVRG